uniref:HpcH/HpaI aldolase/citrate lyase domain-containing protein n=1 Tax=Sphenodon punctatus TaxID=8508 RepID=A0A8D0GPL0_SPHPU
EAKSQLRRKYKGPDNNPIAVPKLGYHSEHSHKYIPRRAVLYVPGDDERKIKKIPSLNVDCAVLDCEDGVALNRKVSNELFVECCMLDSFLQFARYGESCIYLPNRACLDPDRAVQLKKMCSQESTSCKSHIPQYLSDRGIPL